MKILVLDDDQKRANAFADNILSLPTPPGKTASPILDLTLNVDNCKALLGKNQYDLIFLDHDLDDRVYVSPLEFNTGSEIARFMANEPHPNWIGAVIVIHTLNPVGAQYMQKYLPTAFYLPGVWEQPPLLSMLLDIAENEKAALVVEQPAGG